jgi:hypothetical protein
MEPATMRSTTILASFLSLAAAIPALVGATSAALSADCTPVVYAFRHAEDRDKQVPKFRCLPNYPADCTTGLTEVGEMHAKHYLEMVTSIQNLENFCPVTDVYSVSPVLPPKGVAGGTTNPFYTGLPLAHTLSNPADPNVTVKFFDEDNNLVDEKILDEDLKNVTPSELNHVLVAIAETGGSTAIFWTSDGLSKLGEAINSNVKVIPQKGNGLPPRNAAYIFKFDAASETFSPPSSATQYTQCFNFKRADGKLEMTGARYYCGLGENNNLVLPEEKFEDLHGRICDQKDRDFKAMNPGTQYHGYCEFVPSSALK